MGGVVVGRGAATTLHHSVARVCRKPFLDRPYDGGTIATHSQQCGTGRPAWRSVSACHASWSVSTLMTVEPAASGAPRTAGQLADGTRNVVSLAARAPACSALAPLTAPTVPSLPTVPVPATSKLPASCWWPSLARTPSAMINPT